MKELCLQISILCQKYDAPDWARAFGTFATSSEDISTLKRKILGVYAGMTSFSDLILQNKGNVYLEANDELDKLRRELYEEIIHSF